MKINCQINPSISPPIKLGIKNIVLSRLLPFIPVVTSKASPNPIQFITTTETTVNKAVNLNESRKVGSLKAVT
ncbi:hypothetical protein [Clostridium tagluense]|uniref:hypothetical protein n=1 Tax=Clostridium tagluense TaxID=360422 RepID=UPI000F61B69A